jgi:hypothetical protein
MSQEFGTRQEPREVHGILGPGAGGGKGGAGRTVMGGVSGAQSFGTRDAPRTVADGAPTNKGQGARVVGTQAIRRMGRVVQPPPPQANIQRVNVRKVESHGIRPGAQGTGLRSNAPTPELGSQEQSPTKVGQNQENAPNQGRLGMGGSQLIEKKHLASLTLIYPNEGERVVVISKGAAGALQRFFQSHATVARTFWATIMRSVSDAMTRPRGEAGPSGLMEIAVVIRQEDVKALQMACRRVQPSKEARERLKLAFNKAFSREREMNDAETISASSFPKLPQLEQDSQVVDGHHLENVTAP